jgi:hypothetical protein
LVDAAVSSQSHLHLSSHANVGCWRNKIDSELVSNGGTYPDAWVYPCRDYSDDASYLDTPNEATGLTSWDDWHPCPGTYLYQLWRLLNYIKTKETEGVLRYGTLTDSVEVLHNLVDVGDFTAGMKGGGRGSDYDDAVYPHYVVGINGYTSFKNNK